MDAAGPGNQDPREYTVIKVTPDYSIFAESAEFYSILPGSEKWLSFNTEDEKIAATELGKDKLESLSTKDLIRAMQLHPASRTLAFFDSNKIGFSALAKTLSPIATLLDRPDAGAALLSALAEANPSQALQRGTQQLQQMEFVNRLSLIELAIAHPKIYNKLTVDQKQQLTSIAQQHLQEKQKNPDIYGHNSLTNTTDLLAQGDVLARMSDYYAHNLVRTPRGTSIPVTVTTYGE